MKQLLWDVLIVLMVFVLGGVIWLSGVVFTARNMRPRTIYVEMCSQQA